MKQYHVGLIDGGRQTAIFEFADCVDQLSCETLRYFGEREIENFASHKRMFCQPATKDAILKQLEIDYPGRFNKVLIKRILPDDFTAGHANTLNTEIADMNRRLTDVNKS